MNFELTDRAKEYRERVTAFMEEHIYPAEAVYERQMHESGDPHFPRRSSRNSRTRRAAAGSGTSSTRIQGGARV